FNVVLSTANVPSTPAKGSDNSTTVELLDNLQSPGSTGLSDNDGSASTGVGENESQKPLLPAGSL
ncbi:unnamed protein product, partial [Linum tenue]